MTTLYWVNALFLLLPAGEVLGEVQRIFREPAARRRQSLARLVGGGLLFGGAALLALSLIHI